MEQTFFYHTGHNEGIPINSRNEILEILQKYTDNNIIEMDIEFIDGAFCVLAQFRNDACWYNLGRINNMII